MSEWVSECHRVVSCTVQCIVRYICLVVIYIPQKKVYSVVPLNKKKWSMFAKLIVCILLFSKGILLFSKGFICKSIVCNTFFPFKMFYFGCVCKSIVWIAAKLLLTASDRNECRLGNIGKNINNVKHTIKLASKHSSTSKSIKIMQSHNDLKHEN